MLISLFANFDVSSPGTMIPLVASTGFLDGIHPCAIAILIFFVAFLLTLKKNLKSIIFLGGVYIFVIFLTYLAIGVGLLSGVMLFGQHHFFAKLGSLLLILLGVISLKDYFFPKLKFGIKLPRVSNDKIKALLRKSTLPTVIAAAFLVGLCSVPCSGGIYAAITALLASQSTFYSGFLYLLLYNFMFVTPLIILLALAGNPYTLVKLGNWQQSKKRIQKLIMGIIMVLVGLGIYLFFV